MSAAPGTHAVDTSDIVSVEGVTRYWHGAAPAFDRALDPEIAGLGRPAEEIRAWSCTSARLVPVLLSTG
jgi:hypothetical protein